MYANGSIIIFVRQGLFFSDLSTSSFPLLDPYYDYVEINISLNNSFLLSFLNVYASLIWSSSTNNKTDSFFPPFFLPPEISFWRTSTAIIICGTKKAFPIFVGEEVTHGVISSNHVSINDPDIPTVLHCFSGNFSYPDVSYVPSSLAPRRCFKTWLLITYQFYIPSFFFWFFAPTNVPLPLIFKKLLGMTLLSTLNLTVFLQKKIPLFLFPLLLLSLLL